MFKSSHNMRSLCLEASNGTQHFSLDSHSAVPDSNLNLSLNNVPTLVHCACPRRLCTRLLVLAREHHLLKLTSDVTVHLRSCAHFTRRLLGQLERLPLQPSELLAVCVEFQAQSRHTGALQRSLHSDPWLRPASHGLHEAMKNVQRTLGLLTLQTAHLVERCVLSSLHEAAHSPETATDDLLCALVTYNEVVAERALDLSVLTALKVVELLAKERSCGLADRFCLALCRCQQDWLRECQRGIQWDTDILPLFSVSQSHPLPESSIGHDLDLFVQEDKNQMASVLQILATSDRSLSLHNLNRPSDPRRGHLIDTVLYPQYCAFFWPAFFSHMYHTFFPGQGRPEALLSLSVCGEGSCVALIIMLRSILASDAVPELCWKECRRLCVRLLTTSVFVAWDREMCQGLSSALTDKCVPYTVNGSSGVQSRTAVILAQMCQQLAAVLQVVCSTEADSAQFGPSLVYSVMSRCVMSLQLCDLWLRCRTQHCVSSGTLGQLLLLTHGDLPMLQAELQRLCGHVTEQGSRTLSLPNQRAYAQMVAGRSSIEALAASLLHSPGSLCGVVAQDIFQKLMPTGRYWRGKLTADAAVAPSEYAVSAAHAVLSPLLDGIGTLPSTRQISVLSVTLSVFMETWMEHILRERIKFSLQGALQLKCDFEFVCGFLQSSGSGL
ncbi:coiled-coil domain-containing protein 142 isoform X2 [Bombina bombina]|nr:coiled-coil domain-containing protein 142 isoform X2 [Bombina bombina]